jgi:hypothetical protein
MSFIYFAFVEEDNGLLPVEIYGQFRRCRTEIFIGITFCGHIKDLENILLQFGQF